MTDFVTITHPDIAVPARVARTALPHLGPGWQVEGEKHEPVAPQADVSDAQSDDHTPRRGTRRSAQ